MDKVSHEINSIHCDNHFKRSHLWVSNIFLHFNWLLWFQDETRAFKRQLEDKRAIIENNLLTGRQHLQQAGATNSGLHMNTNDNSISSDTSESDGI